MSRHNLNKGDQAMNYAVAVLEEKGYRVEKAKKVRFQPQDFFGLWDLIAIKSDSLKWVQVSCKPIYDKGVAFKRAAHAFPLLPGMTKEYWHFDGLMLDKKPIFNIRLICNGVKKEKDPAFKRAYTRTYVKT